MASKSAAKDRLQALIRLTAGLWMVVSPWVLGFITGENVAALSAWVLGAAIIVFAGTAVYIHRTWEEALNVILGICLASSPWALGFADQVTPTTNAVVIGLLVIAFGIWAMLMDGAVQRWWHEHYGAHGTR